MYGFVYETTNLVNGKKYIGKKKYDKNGHWKNYLGSGVIFKKAVEKYGKENFERKILCECETKEELTAKEIEYIANANAMNDPMYYNVSHGGEGEGRPCSEETRKKISEVNSNNPWKNGHPWTGRHHTEESKKKMSEARTGKPGWKPSEELKEKKRINTPHKSVMCIETGEIYMSVAQASNATQIDRGSISHVCHGRYSIAGGYHWKFIEE